MTKKYLGSLACLLLLLCCRSTRVPPAVGSVESLPDLEEVLEAYVSASGGHEALLGIDDRLCEGNLTWQFPNQEPSEVVIPARILAAAPSGLPGSVSWPWTRTSSPSSRETTAS